MASLPGSGGVYSKSILGLRFPNSQWELDSPVSDAHPGVVPPFCVESDPTAVPGDWDLFPQHHGGGGGELGGQGEARVRQGSGDTGCFLPPAVFPLSSQTVPSLSHPNPQQPQALNS